MDNTFEQIAGDHMLPLLKWAYKKLGDKSKAEDLTQEVLLQVFTAIRKSDASISDPEHFLWKVAHYTWCNFLRDKERRKMCVSMENLQLEDSRDFTEDYAEEEYRNALMTQMRRQISRLNYLQREIMVSFYIDGLSVQRIAEKHLMTPSAVKWHLFSTRQKLKKEISSMENKEYVYRPRSLHMGISGKIASMGTADIVMINNSLTKQNICIACYRQPRTVQELAAQLGIPSAYIESDLKWLAEREFVEKNGSGYSTLFPIYTESEEQAQYGVFLKHKESLSDIIVKGLAASEDAVRSIGFYGSDKPLDRLLWLLIYQFCRSLHIPYPDVQKSIRMDGGEYLPLGFDRTEQENVRKVVDTCGWSYNGSMMNDGFYWFGMYNFGKSEIEEMLDGYTPDGKILHALLKELINAEYDTHDYDETKRYTLAQLAQKGFVTVQGDHALPVFCILTADQYRQLKENIFDPIAKKLEPVIPLLIADMEECCRDMLPRQLKHYYHTSVALALHDLAFLTTVLAFQEGLLYRPVDKHDGEFLTLMYVKE